MKIAFVNDHSYYGGLSNNGGTRTVLRSCATLEKLGHRANVVTNSDKFTWFKHERPWHTIPKDADAVVAVAISDVRTVRHSSVEKKAYWARPFELWQMAKHECLREMRKLVKADGKVLVNSGWQKRYLEKKDIPSTVVFAGIDYDEWRPIPDANRARIGAQHSTKDRKGWPEAYEIMKASGMKMISFGSPKQPRGWRGDYKRNADNRQLRLIYGSCRYFICSSTLEGFYNAAAQAVLCGCVLVSNGHPRNGCSDFADNDNSIVYHSVGEAVDKIRSGCSGNVADARARLKAIGDRLTNMKRLVEVL